MTAPEIYCSRCRKRLDSDQEMKFHTQCVRKVQFAGIVADNDGTVDSVITNTEVDK